MTTESVRRFDTDSIVGLSTDEVRDRQTKGLINADVSIPTKSIKLIIRDNLCTLFNLINIILAVAVFITGSYRNMLFMGVILCNILIGTTQEIRAKRTIDKLSIMSSPKANVIRDGKQFEIAITEIVLDDLLILERGAQIPTDCIVLDGECDVDESLLSGESDSVHKTPGDILLSGSFVQSGRCTAKCEHVGEDNYAAKIQKDAKYIKKINSVILASTKKIIKLSVFFVVPMGIIFFLNQLSMNSWQQAVISTTASVTSMIPQGLVLLTSSVLAISIIRLSTKKVLVQDLYCIETLARVDLLCLDKTGTITEGRMELSGISEINGSTISQAEHCLKLLCSALTDKNDVMNAIRAKYDSECENSAVAISPFSSERKWSGASFSDFGSVIMGAPEYIYRNNMPSEIKESYMKLAEDSRVLLLVISDEIIKERTLPENITPIAFLLVSDVIRESAKDTLKYFADQDVKIKLISGDNPITVSNIAKRVGLLGYEKYIDGGELKTEQDIERAATEYTVFGRVSPAQKKQLVIALKKAGHTVAMTGDGVNDVLALKEADCSIAMASGSDAARSVSQIVMLNSNFKAIPSIVHEGRRCINNIQRSAALFLCKTFYATVITFLFLFIRTPYPFIPIQMTFINLVAIGIPSFILALEPNKERVKHNFLKNVFSAAIPGSITTFLSIIAVLAISTFFRYDFPVYSTLSIMVTMFVGLLLVIKLSIPFNTFRLSLLGLLALVTAVPLIFFRRFLSVTVPSGDVLTILLVLFLFATVLFYISHKIVNKVLRKAKAGV